MPSDSYQAADRPTAGVRILTLLWSLQPGIVLACSAAITALLAAGNYFIGAAISFQLLYLGPVVLATWLVGREAGFAVGTLAAGCWLAVDLLAFPGGVSPLVHGLNAVTRLGAFAVVTTILLRWKAAVDYERQATRTDALTGICNGRGFREFVRTELRRLRRTGGPLTVAFIDLDHFKKVNDDRGHAAGDALLRTVARVIVHTLRSTDVAARVGGDEFAMLLTETGAEPAAIVLRKVHNALRIAFKEAGWPVTASVGAISCEEAPADEDELIHLADELMYEVKRTGRNRVSHALYDPAAA